MNLPNNLEASWVTQNFFSFERGLNGSAQGPLHRIRKEALARFCELGFPTTQDENWKYTNVADIARASFSLPVRDKAAIKTLANYATLVPLDLFKHRLVFVDGAFSSELSLLEDLPKGLTVASLARIGKIELNSETTRKVEQYLARVARFEDQAFVALNTAFLGDGAFIHVTPGARIQDPLHILHLSSGSSIDSVSHPRALIIAERGSELRVVESFASLSDARYFTNQVTEVVVEEGAALDYYKLQVEGQVAYHCGSLYAHLSDKVNFRCHTFSFGGLLVRNEIHPLLNGSGSVAVLNGLSILDAQQHVDNSTVIDHAKPHCESHELYKGVYAGKSSGAFSGTIIVREGAQKTNALQTNKSLLLTPTATVESRPQLKIWADDVKCTHGATVGQLDEDALFYLRSRGIPSSDAMGMLIQAFACDVTAGVRSQKFEEFLIEMVDRKLRTMVRP